MDDAPRRSIVREHAFEHGLRALIPDAREADGFTEGAEFLLSADPRAGIELVRGGGLWVLPMAPIDGRGVALYYFFDAETVWFVSIGPSEAEAGEGEDSDA